MGQEANTPYFLGIDLGGTNIKAGVVDRQGKPLSRADLPTHADKGPEEGIRRICQAGREAVEKAGLKLKDIHAVGVGSPGPMDLKKQIIINPHNLPGWINLPLAERVGNELGLRAVLQNDANAAAYGEYWAGAGRGVNSLVQFTLGTGIGCGVVINGRILEGEHSHGAESGHIRIALDHPRYNATGLYGSLEAYASAKAIIERAQEAMATGQRSSLEAILSRGEELSAKDIFDAAAAGDELGERLVEQTAFYLAVGAVNLMHVIDPNVVVFSGGMIAAGETFLDRIRYHVRRNALPVPAAETLITFAQLGTDAGFIGAAGCAQSKFATSRS
jgi:glucokinase